MDHKEPEKLVLELPEAGSGDTFGAAMKHASAAAEARLGPVILISWKNNITGACSPDVESCTCGLEGWELYALSRGAELRVDVGGEYVFMFKQV